jgi:preprotein translocase subunit SecA
MSWFKKTPKSKRLEDKVYMNDKSKYNAIAEELKISKISSSPMFLVYFFDEIKDKVIKLFEEQQIKYHIIETGFIGDLNLPAEGEIHLIKAKTLNKVYNLKQTSHKAEKPNCSFLFVEHYPIFSKEEAVLNKIDLLTDFKATICFYISLDEPLLQKFGSDSIKGLMQKLGLKDNECIEHSFVTKSISNAQQKIEKKASNDSEATSQDAWFKKNFISST